MIRKLIICTLGILSIFLSSCATRTYDFIKKDRESLRNFITYTNSISAINHFDIKSEEYALPTETWVKKEFVPFYKKFIFNHNLSWYEYGSNDCTQFTLYALTCAHIIFFKDKNHPTEHNLSVAQFTYLSGLDRHSLVCFVVNNDGQEKLIFFEPQWGSFVDLDPRIVTCFDIVF